MKKRVLPFLLFLLMLFPAFVHAQIDYDSLFCAVRIDVMIGNAKKYLGTPYVWAANGPNSFDCSGFVNYVYASVGVDIKRNSKQLSETGKVVTVRDARRGDLVFFLSTKSMDREISHVGIVITDYRDGNFQFIHANSTAGCVSISNYNEPYYRNNYGGLRRVMPCLLGDNE